MRRPVDEELLGDVRSKDVDLNTVKRLHGSVTSTEDVALLRGTDAATASSKPFSSLGEGFVDARGYSQAQRSGGGTVLSADGLTSIASNSTQGVAGAGADMDHASGGGSTVQGMRGGTRVENRARSSLLANKNAFQYAISAMSGAGAFDRQNGTFDCFPNSFKMQLQRKLSALCVPPLPPDLGTLMSADGSKRYSAFLDPAELAAAAAKRRTDWKPREGGLLMTIREHRGPVNRLAVAHDRHFFVSASADKTVKVALTLHTTHIRRTPTIPTPTKLTLALSLPLTLPLTLINV